MSIRASGRIKVYLLCDVSAEGLLILSVELLGVVMGGLLSAHVVDRPAHERRIRKTIVAGLSGLSTERQNLRVQAHILLCIELLLLLAF